MLLGVVTGFYRTMTRADGDEAGAALEELRRAYARGEFSDEEFENRRERLEEDRYRRPRARIFHHIVTIFL